MTRDRSSTVYRQCMLVRIWRPGAGSRRGGDQLLEVGEEGAVEADHAEEGVGDGGLGEGQGGQAVQQGQGLGQLGPGRQILTSIHWR